MKKHFLFLTVAAFCFMIVNAATTFTVDGYKYTVLSEDELTVEFGTDAKYGSKTSIIVPETVEYSGNTYTVVSIGQYAFAPSSSSTTACNLTSVVLPETIKSIGKYAFLRCSKITNFTFPANLESIGEMAFSYALNILGKTVILPESLTALDNNALNTGSFNYTNLPIKKLVVGNNVVSLGGDVASVDTLIYNAKNAISTSSGTYDSFDVTKCLIIGDDVCNLPHFFVQLYENYGGYTELKIPDKVEYLSPKTFKGQANIAHLVFGKNLRLVAPTAFDGSITVEAITCKSKMPPVVYDPLTASSPSFATGSVFDNCTLTVPVGTEMRYGLAEFWRNFVINMEEDEELGNYSEGQVSSDGFSFTQNSNIIETQNNTILPISIANKYPVVSIEFDMELPANIELGSPVLSTTDRTEGATISTSTQADGSIHVIIQANGTIAAGKGAILNLNIVASRAGNYEIKLKNVVLTTGQEITLDDENLQFVANHKKGDYNEDGDVDVVDAQSLLNYVLGI